MQLWEKIVQGMPSNNPAAKASKGQKLPHGDKLWELG